MKGCNTEERHIVKSIVNAMKKDMPMAFRRVRVYKKQKKMIKEFLDLYHECWDKLYKNNGDTE
jgi:hypothetical protein